MTGALPARPPEVQKVRVSVGLVKWLEGADTGATIRTRVRSLVPGVSAAERLRSLLIPAGSNERTAAIELPPGRYLFEAYLPSGDIATELAEFPAGATTAQVLIHAEDSAHEWLSWQHLAAHGPGALERSEPGWPAAADLPPGPLSLIRDVENRLLRHLGDLWQGKQLADLGLETQRELPQYAHDGPFTSHVVAPDSAGPLQTGQHYYGWLSQPPEGPPLLCRLPLPWPQADASGFATLEVLADARGSDPRAPDREWPVTLSVLPRDNVIAPVLGYLMSGQSAAASRIVEAARDRLFLKFDNALAAAAGAYALLRGAAPRPGERAEWLSWIGNLRKYFTWLPDGAIQDGWRHLQGLGGPADLPQAADAFLEGLNRGLPYYSMGVRLLLDGLSLLAAEEGLEQGPRVKNALAFVRRLAVRTDARQAFTVVRLGR